MKETGMEGTWRGGKEEKNGTFNLFYQ
jgi:hypothetical protein